MSVEVFISYSNKDRRLAHKVKEGLAELGFNIFLAHDDIRISVAWRREILKRLRSCEIFVPILTEAFTKSKWTDQEVGYALARGARIAPLKVDVDPYGFIGEYIRRCGPREMADKWVQGSHRRARCRRT